MSLSDGTSFRLCQRACQDTNPVEAACATRRVPPSRPGEFHPEPLTGPDVSLSTYPARTTFEGCRLPPRPAGSSCSQLTLSISTLVTCSLRSTGVTPLHHYYGAVRPWPAHRYFRPRGSTLVPFPLPSQTRFSSSIRKPRLESRLLYTGHRLASKQVSARLVPE